MKIPLPTLMQIDAGHIIGITVSGLLALWGVWLQIRSKKPATESVFTGLQKLTWEQVDRLNKDIAALRAENDKVERENLERAVKIRELETKAAALEMAKFRIDDAVGRIMIVLDDDGEDDSRKLVKIRRIVSNLQKS